MKTLSKAMDINQLMYRLPHKQLCLMECDYRSNSGGIRNVYNDKKEVVGQKTILFMWINRKGVDSMCSKFPLYADTDSGKVKGDYNLTNYIDVDNITLDDLLILFKEKYTDELGFEELEECIYDHDCDVELRRRVLQLVALKLLYSNRTILKRGYERAKKFIDEFNKKMGLNLSTEEIDEAINRDYTNGERWEPVLKTYVNQDGKERSYWTFEDVAKKEKSRLKKTKELVKSLFKQ